jgi:dTMP kinase
MRISNFIWRYNYSVMKGKFIVLEGLDRCGKSSMTKFLQEKCSGDNQENKAVVISFPNRKSAIGSMINDFLLNKADIGNEAIHLLFSANRWEAMKDIERILNEGKNIICDRYWYSGVAYSFAKGLDF